MMVYHVYSWIEDEVNVMMKIYIDSMITRNVFPISM